ncbi:hypothetical protein IIM_04941 [Bacillus cereus VD107]|nr:hypothetical protein IIM_04941 [Bacillus cereus VD107]
MKDHIINPEGAASYFIGERLQKHIVSLGVKVDKNTKLLYLN